MKTGSSPLVAALALLCACTAAPRPRPVAVEASATRDYAAVVSVSKALACDGAEVFGGGSQFDCNREACVQGAHDRAEESCPGNCKRWHDCTDPLVCSGQSALCLAPLVLEFKTPRCPDGIGYYCSGACKCSCPCVSEFY